jgi:hypothetical protein
MRGPMAAHACGVGRALLCLCLVPTAWTLEPTDIKPRPGLILTNTLFASIIAGNTGFGAHQSLRDLTSACILRE